MAKSPKPPQPSALNERLIRIEATFDILKWVIPILTTVVVALTVVTFTSVLPEKIQTGIANSESLNRRFGGLDSSLKEIKSDLDKLTEDLRKLNTGDDVAAKLKKFTSRDTGSLKQGLMRANELLDTTKKLRIPLSAENYSEVSRKLVQQYESSNESVKKDVWATLVELANTKTFTDLILYPISESTVSEARSNNRYFEGEIDLSSRSNWQNTIFRNCTITVRNPSGAFSLENSRFIDCTFVFDSDHIANRKLLASFLGAPGATITVPKFTVDQPRYDRASGGVYNTPISDRFSYLGSG